MSDKKILSFPESSQLQAGQSVQSRLAAILAADVVGYTQLVEEDTAATVVAWQEVRDNFIEPGVDQQSGRIIKFTGDGFLAEFPTVQAAVECAIKLQDEFAQSSLEFRMGVSIGDIIDDGRDIHGEGVNIAARLEALSNPGGICISGDVYNLIRNRISEEFVDLGQQNVKHVSQPVAVFAVKRFGAPAEISSENTAPLGQKSKRAAASNSWYVKAAAGLILVVAGIAALVSWNTSVPPPAAPPPPQQEKVAPQPQAQSQPAVIAKAHITRGKSFQDCQVCPVMFVVPAGAFNMGYQKGDADEKPLHKVVIPKNFAVGKFEITFNEWESCTSNGGCGAYNPNDKGWGRGTQPVINVSWQDAQTYIKWLSGRAGKKYRLLTEAEWEYAARGGASTLYPWGVTIDAGKANYGLFRNKTVPVGFYNANAFGLHDVIGNVWEWVADCYSKTAYSEHRSYPSAVLIKAGKCRRVLRGGSWNVDMSDGFNLLRASIREKASSNGRYNNYGFRVARDLD